mmetsp:Transcript_23718/g.48188  ORF Transcript_23718/g.48188 Transcript_23718/m.48188 type:complete len:406 (-) Transcript_23718:44-1261(-)
MRRTRRGHLLLDLLLDGFDLRGVLLGLLFLLFLLGELLFNLAQIGALVIDVALSDLQAVGEGCELELHALLELVHVRCERLDGGSLCPQYPRVVSLRRLRRTQVKLLEEGSLLRVLRVHPRLVVGDRVGDALKRSDSELYDVVVVDEVPGGRGDTEVGTGRQLDVFHLEAVKPLTPLAQRRLLQSQLERLVLVREVDARVVEHRYVMARLKISELKGAARVVRCAGQRLLGRVGRLRVGDVPFRAVIHDGVNVGMLVVMRVVQILKRVEEDADSCPVIFPAENGALNVVRVGDKPDRKAIAIQVHRGAAGTELEECSPLRGSQRRARCHPALLRLALAGETQEIAVHDRRATNLPRREVSHASVGADLVKWRCERLISIKLERLSEVGLGRRERSGAQQKGMPEP